MKTDSNSKKPKKGSICEEDIATLLRRYPATAVLSLLQEVAILPESKIDWNALVKKTNTGISDAKECQMLWRHLAYSDALLDRPEDGAELLDDDSDLEFELEAYPTVNSDVAADIAACVKVLITSDLPSSAIIGHNLTVESLLTINATNGQSSRSASENKQTFTVPVSVDKHQSFVASAEGLDETGNMPPRKRRKAWSKAEDLELEAAVEKFGEGNWANIVKVNFKGDRTASQLSQRWAIIRKRKNLTVEITKSSGSQLSETQVIAARHAMSLALDMPSRKPGIGSKLSQNQSHQATVPGKPSPSEPTSTQNTIGLIKRSPPNASLDTDLGIKAAAVAAGARIATVKDAASLLIASQAKKAVHIIPSGRSQIKCSVPGPSSLRPGTFHLSSGSSSQAASTSSSTVKIAPPAKADTAAASDARVREQTTTDLPLEQEPIVKVVEAKAAYEPSNAPQSREHGASASAESTSETIQKESEMIDGKSNIEGDATNSGQKYCLSH